MDSSTRVQIEDLRAGLFAILDKVQREFGDEIELDADYYWHLDLRDAFDIYSDPTPNTGQLSDDVASLRELLRRSDSELYVWHDLSHVIGILQRIAALDLPSH